MASKQLIAYLLIVCSGSITIIVFVNASVTFVITDIIGSRNKIGDAVGTLTFADELVALATVPLWGVLADRVGSRTVVTLGYVISGLALLLTAYAATIYPALLLARITFATGASSLTCMITALLPAVGVGWNDLTINQEWCDTPDQSPNSTPRDSRSIPSPASPLSPPAFPSIPPVSARFSIAYVAGLAGLATGCGATLSVAVFLQLPAWFQSKRFHMQSSEALQHTYHIMFALTLFLAGASWLALNTSSRANRISNREQCVHIGAFPMLMTVLQLGFHDKSLALANIGGVLARASSVCISAFVPLYVKHHFVKTGDCKHNGDETIQSRCDTAYIIAAQLSGIAQLTALTLALVFGFLNQWSKSKASPLLLSSSIGLLGCFILITLKDRIFQESSAQPIAYFVMVLLGTSQIGAIVSSLSLLGNVPAHMLCRNERIERIARIQQGGINNETEPLLEHTADGIGTVHARGSMAGVYSFYGACGILILSKGGGIMFDRISPIMPFLILGSFNAIVILFSTYHIISSHCSHTQ